MHNNIAEILHGHALFNEFHPLEPRFLDTFKRRLFKKHDVIYRPGSAVQYAYLIVDGAVSFEFSSSSGQPVHVGMVDKGFIIGELELLSGIEYHSTATAHDTTELILIPKNTLLALIAEKPAFAVKFTKQLATNFYFFQIIAAERDVSDLKAKLANLLMSIGLRFGLHQGESISLEVSNDQLSNMLNASRQRVNMQLNEWQAAGLLQCNYGQIIIVDVKRFSEHSGLANSVISENDITPYQ